MIDAPRRARVRAFAKLNLDLRVLDRRPDGYHELRTVFQTISLADTIDLEFEAGRGTRIELESDPYIPGNLVERAARLAMEALGIRGAVRCRLRKRIPMGGGLGGGSSDAAAVLLTLPVLAGRRVSMEALLDLGARLGSDVPFLLLGGTAVGLGRGTDLFPLPELPVRQGIVVVPSVQVSTPEAYRALGRGLTGTAGSRNMNSFQALVWRLACGVPDRAWEGPLENDFEAVVFDQYPQLKSLKMKLRRLGANPAMLTGSGAALFGFFRSRPEAVGAACALGEQVAIPVSTVSRARYRAMWWRCLAGHLGRKSWPPESRY